MNGVRVLTVKSALSGDCVHCSFHSDRILSTDLLHTNVKGSALLLYAVAYVIDIVCRSYFVD